MYYFNSIHKKTEIWFYILLLSTLLIFCDKTILHDETQEPTYQKSLVCLNHIYLTIDNSTYSHISNSDFLKEHFSDIITQTVKADNNETWTATYITGLNTCIEFFNSNANLFNNQDGENKGFSGIAFGIEVIGGIDSLFQSITNSGIDHFEKDVRHIQTASGEMPWFYYMQSTIEDSARILSTWVMEYDVEYMKYSFPDVDPDKINITRELYNHKSYNNELLLKDIIEIELALNEIDYNELVNELQYYGCQTEKDDNITIGKGPEFKIVIRNKSENKSGICRIKFSLTDNPYNQQTVDFGNKSKLTLNEDKTAEWFFSI